MAKEISRVFQLGKIDFNGVGRKINPCEVEMRLAYKESSHIEFSCVGSIYNQTKTDVVLCGQIIETIKQHKEKDQVLSDIIRFWELYHCNSLNAGTKEQMDALKQAEKKGLLDMSLDYYDRSVKYLKEIGLYIVKYLGRDYAFGSGWIYMPIPESDLKLIESYIKKGA